MKMDEVVGELKKEIGPGIEAINARIKQLEEVNTAVEQRFAEAEKARSAADEAVKELTERLARKERLTADSGVRVASNGELRSRVSDETAGELVRMLKGSQSRVLNSTTDADGGYLIAPEFASEIIRLLPEVGLYRRVARTVPMATDEKNFGTLATGITTYWPAESVAITASNPTFGQLKLTAKILAGFVAAPESFLDDASPEVGQFLAELFIEGIAKEEDRVGLAGDVTGASDAFNGILFAAGVNTSVMPATKTKISDLTADDLLSVQTAVPDGGRGNARYFLSPTVFDAVRKLKDTENNYIWQRPSDGAPGTIWGKPYELTERMPAYSATVTASKSFIAYGDPKYLLLGDRKQIAVKASDVAGDSFQKIQTHLRVHERIAIASYGTAFAKIVTAAS